MFKRLIWYWHADRLGPDILTTHLLLYFKRSNWWVCKKKFNTFGEGSEFRPHAYATCTSNISIGKNIVIRPNTMLFASDEETGKIVIEDDVLIGAGVHFYVNNHCFKRTDIPIISQGYGKSKSILIKSGAWIGACCMILPGVTIGRNAVVGTGSIVTRDVEPFTVAAGNPAKTIKNIIL